MVAVGKHSEICSDFPTGWWSRQGRDRPLVPPPWRMPSLQDRHCPTSRKSQSYMKSKHTEEKMHSEPPLHFQTETPVRPCSHPPLGPHPGHVSDCRTGMPGASGEPRGGSGGSQLATPCAAEGPQLFGRSATRSSVTASSAGRVWKKSSYQDQTYTLTRKLLTTGEPVIRAL